jgi:hypothetical protein
VAEAVHLMRDRMLPLFAESRQGAAPAAAR